MKKPPVLITVDGPASSGKSSITRMIAGKLGYDSVSSGKLYRLTGMILLEKRASPASYSPQEVTKLIEEIEQHTRLQGDQVFYKGADISSALRSEEVARSASQVASSQVLRSALLPWQHNLYRLCQAPGIIFDGRDMGTVVFARTAHYKFFLTASLEKRAERRLKELHPTQSLSQGKKNDFLKHLQTRDKQDRERSVAPLKPAADAIIIDTTHLSLESAMQALLSHLTDGIT